MACGGTSGDASVDPVRARARMVDEQIAARGVRDRRVLAAMKRVPRHELVPERLRDRAYEDGPLPIGYGQTISQPFVVGFMSEALELEGHEKVLEIGTGSGYQAAVLAELAAEVYSIELEAPLAERARRDLVRLGYEKVDVRHGDGYLGWPDAAPFDAILLTAAPPEVPQALIDQLAEGGRLVAPVGRNVQEIVRLVKTPDGIERERMIGVRFVPMRRGKSR
jgi:protein-L-isoaspartate(D-aspartate) O-methyltransferase